MCTIQLKEILAGNNYPDAGEVLYNEFVKHLADSERIVVDMSGVDNLPSMFLNTSIGRIIDKFGKQTLKDHLSFSMISKSQASRLVEYLNHYSS